MAKALFQAHSRGLPLWQHRAQAAPQPAQTRPTSHRLYSISAPHQAFLDSVSSVLQFPQGEQGAAVLYHRRPHLTAWE